MQNSVALYRTLERETGQAIDWHEVGSVRLASSAERWSEMKRAATTARGFGFEMELISPKQAQEKFPYITLDGSRARPGCRATAMSILRAWRRRSRRGRDPLA